jgi:hypothetical protein
MLLSLLLIEMLKRRRKGIIKGMNQGKGFTKGY